LVSCKWIFKRKYGAPRTDQQRLRGRLVARVFTQREEIHYNNVFSPVVKHRSVRMLLAMVVVFNLGLEQMDVKTTFLYGDLDETIYMNQPKDLR